MRSWFVSFDNFKVGLVGAVAIFGLAAGPAFAATGNPAALGMVENSHTVQNAIGFDGIGFDGIGFDGIGFGGTGLVDTGIRFSQHSLALHEIEGSWEEARATCRRRARNRGKK